MTHPELIEALRKSAQQEAEVIWQAARDKAEECRNQATSAMKDRRTRVTQEIAAIARELEDTARNEAERAARRIRMTASTVLGERAYATACASLSRFRGDGYEVLFAALAAEIPPRTWQRARVNPADRSLVRTHFADAEVVTDEAIVGGMEVETEDGRIKVRNTLETRLARAWQDILPRLIDGIIEEFSDNRSPA